MKRVFILCILLSTFLSSWAYDFEVNGIYYNLLSKTKLTCEVAQSPNKNYSGSVVIPSQVSYGGQLLSVASIGEEAFYNCNYLTSVTIPEEVIIVGKWAFSGCDRLTNLTLNARNCESMENSCLRYLTNVTIGDEVTRIPSYAFYGCKKLSSVTIPNSVIDIGTAAFGDCVGLKTITIPNSVRWLHGFDGCTGLSSITIPESVETIGGFTGCTSLKSIVLPNSLEVIYESAFEGCKSLESVTMPEKMEKIGRFAFKGCTSLKSISIPKDVEKIEESTFENCTSLTTVKMLYGLKVIGYSAFEGCSNLTSITLPMSLREIENYAFQNCINLTEIRCLSNIPPACSSYVGQVSSCFNNVSKTKCVIKVPQYFERHYSEEETWRDFWNIVALGTEQCAKPTISLVDGQLVIESATIGSTCKTTITSADMKTTENNVIELTGVYTISSYAWRQGDIDSETATATLIWVNPTIDATSVMSMEMKKALLLRSAGSGIAVEGMNEGETIDLYSINGQLLDKVAAQTETTTIGTALRKGQIYIIKVGDRSVKFRY